MGGKNGCGAECRRPGEEGQRENSAEELWIGKPSPKVSLLEDRLKQRTWVSGFCCAALTAPGLGKTDFPKWP